jgi:hypothetical protein
MKRESLIDLQKRLNSNEPYKLNLGLSTYLMTDVFSENGGSCIAYIAERIPDKNELQNIQRRKNVIKEFYPLSLSDSIKRNNDGSLGFSACETQFAEKKAQFNRGNTKLSEFYCRNSNNTMNGAFSSFPDINHTAYSVLELTNGQTLNEEKKKSLSACEIAQIMASVCDAVKLFTIIMNYI